MGDRAYCRLRLKTPASAELLALLQEELGDPEEEYQGVEFGYEEVNYATLPNLVKNHLVEHKIPFLWSNEAGDEYGAGVYISDGNEGAEYVTNNGDIALTVKEAGDPVKLAEASRWQQVMDELRS